MAGAKIKKDTLRLIFDRLRDSYRIIGPRIENSVIVLAEIEFEDLPVGYKDHQGRGVYQLSNPPLPSFGKGGAGGLGEDQQKGSVFSFSVGPHSFKRFFHPPVKELFAFKKSRRGISIATSLKKEKPFAFIGMRACDISALKLYDRIFLEGPVRDRDYDSLRKDSLIIAVNCLYPGDNCFCHSMGTGPELKDGFDLAISELADSFLLEAGTSRGKDILPGLPSEEITDIDMNEKSARAENCRKMMKKSVKSHELPWLIYRNLEHPRWAEIASRDLECGNCTQVCPTCFCNSTYDLLHFSWISRESQEISGRRMRKWDSCFSRNFARVHGGNFRPSRMARYRQWMSHKLAYMLEQFGLPGCVGCGRCITWCPVGIDITEELEALRK